MLTQSDLSTIETVVNDKIANNELFTAFDVTVAVRNLGSPVKHFEVKPEVYALVNANPSYTYANTHVGSGVSANVFYNPSVSVLSDYLNGSSVTSSTASVTTTKPAKTSNTLVVDAWNRVRLGANALRSIGLNAGDEALVFFTNSGITVSNDPDISTSPADKQLVVDEYTNLRIKLPSNYQASTYDLTVDTTDNFALLLPA